MRALPKIAPWIFLLVFLWAAGGRAELQKRGDVTPSKSATTNEASKDCGCSKDEKKSGPWSGSVALGLSASVGEDHVTTLSADIDVLYQARPHRLKTRLTSFYSVENGSNSVNRQYGETEYRYYGFGRLYLFGATSAERNLQQDLRFRSTTDIGPGYQIVERKHPEAPIVKKDSASIQVGAGYRYQRLSAGAQREVDQNFIFQASGSYSVTFPRSITWDSRLAFTLPPGEIDLWRFLGDITLNVPIVGALGVQARLTLDYLNGPVLDSRGGRKLTFFGSLGVSYNY